MCANNNAYNSEYLLHLYLLYIHVQDTQEMVRFLWQRAVLCTCIMHCPMNYEFFVMDGVIVCNAVAERTAEVYGAGLTVGLRLRRRR